MSQAIRQRIYNMCSAYGQGNLDFVLNFMDDDVHFVSHAPLAIFPCLGKQRGKAAVAKTLETIHAHFEFHSYLPIFTIVEGEHAAVIVLAVMKQRHGANHPDPVRSLRKISGRPHCRVSGIPRFIRRSGAGPRPRNRNRQPLRPSTDPLVDISTSQGCWVKLFDASIPLASLSPKPG